MLYLLAISVFLTFFLFSYVVVNNKKEESDSQVAVLKNAGKLLAIFGPITIILNRYNKQIFAKGMLAEYKDNLSKRIQYVDKNSPTDADSFIIIQELSGLISLLFGLLLLPFLENKQSISIFAILAFALILYAIGPMIMYVMLGAQISKKKKNIIKHWPFALDLIAISVQAGMDIVRAVDLFVASRDNSEPLTMEFKCFLNELGLGKRRADALLDLGKRLDSPNINSVLVDIVQAEQMGTPLAAVLRMESREYRSRRAQIAEKKALEAPVKMLFPLLFCIFPAVFIVLLGPLLIQFMSGAK